MGDQVDKEVTILAIRKAGCSHCELCVRINTHSNKESLSARNGHARAMIT